MLALAPGTVNLDAAERGDTRPLAAVMAQLRSNGVGSVSANGVLGDPAGAAAEDGRHLLDHLAADLISAVGAWWK
jgi:creatinine amidohydrolase